jgi:hypothetical protein
VTDGQALGNPWFHARAWNIPAPHRFRGLQPGASHVPCPNVETPRFEPAADRASQAERDIQAPLDAKEKRSFKDGGEEKETPAMQAGARAYPAPPFPEQHQVKPGIEAKLDPAPMYDAPFYKGSGKLEGKVALITGADSGIGRAVAVLFAREGADVAIAYLDEESDARDQGRRRGKAAAPSCCPATSPIPPTPRPPSNRRSRIWASWTSWSTTPPSRSTCWISRT